MKNILKTLLLTISISLTLFANDVATVTGVNGDATIQRNGTEIKIALGSVLEEKDTVITSENAKVQIIFKDETIVTIGKNSNFSISEYLFEDGVEPVVKFSMLKGAMRTITGKIGKIAPEKFKVTAKTATIGIRGTNFTINITEDNLTEVYCTFGAISIAIDNNEHIVEQGFFITVSPDGETNIQDFKADDLKSMKKSFSSNSTNTQTSNNNEVLANNTPTDNTTENFENITVTNISNSGLEASFVKNNDDLNENYNNSNNDLDNNENNNNDDLDNNLDNVPLADLLAGYTMNDAVYSGEYQVTSDQIETESILGTSGDAVLEIDFSKDTILLKLGDEVFYDANPSFSGDSFSVIQSSYRVGDERGTANGTFQGETGQQVKGDFKLHEGHIDPTEGTFYVSTEQELH